MKQLILSLFVAVFSFGFVADAEARRLGGGGSLGMQRSAPAQAPRQPAATPPSQTPAAAPARQPGRSGWMGPVAGLAAGLGLAALASHLGFGEELASVMLLLLLAVAAVVVFRLLTRRSAGDATRPRQPLQYAGAPAAGRADGSAARFDAARAPSSGTTAATGFDAEAFARQAKVNFIRLQAANDAGDLDDIRQFTTPEMFAELRLQLADRGAAPQRTDVIELDAEVIEVTEEAGRYVVSVRFSGLLREEAGAAPAPFDEIWHLVKPTTGSAGWVIAGIQQTH